MITGPWTCFHCDESFTDVDDARHHFGTSTMHEPGCVMRLDDPEKSLLSRLREAEAELRRYHEEDTDLHRKILAMSADHGTALREEEERGYAKGLAAGRALAKELDRAARALFHGGFLSARALERGHSFQSQWLAELDARLKPVKDALDGDSLIKPDRVHAAALAVSHFAWSSVRLIQPPEAVEYLRELLTKLREALKADTPPDEPYLIWTNYHRAWWRPDSSGYTTHVAGAGRYSRAEAIDICARCRDGFRTEEVPNEIPIAERDVLACMEKAHG